jgi:REP element-mobilizing transposase RayT
MRVPHPFALFAKGWDRISRVPKGLQRRHGGNERHFITCSCNHRKPFLGSATRRNLFLKILEEVRKKYDFVVWGYVVMPEHFHLLISEPSTGTVARAMQVLKQRVSRECNKRKPLLRDNPSPFLGGVEQAFRPAVKLIKKPALAAEVAFDNSSSRDNQ